MTKQALFGLSRLFGRFKSLMKNDQRVKLTRFDFFPSLWNSSSGRLLFGFCCLCRFAWQCRREQTNIFHLQRFFPSSFSFSFVFFIWFLDLSPLVSYYARSFCKEGRGFASLSLSKDEELKSSFTLMGIYFFISNRDNNEPFLNFKY